MRASDRSQINPKSLEDFSIFITVYNGNEYDISALITEVSIFESIYNSFLYGEIIVLDNSAMLSKLPIIGQERIKFAWFRDEERVEKEFFVVGVFDAKQNLPGVGSYGLTITSEKQVRNAISLFSKSYRGRGDEIIQSVYQEFLDVDIEVDAESKTAHSIVFPYIKPLAACDMVRKNILAEDGTPFFIFEKFYDDPGRESTVLTSYGQMYEQKPLRKIQPEIGGDVDKRGQIYNYQIMRAYDTLEQLTKGAFASSTITVDPMANRVEIFDFNFRKHAEPIAKDNISVDFGFSPSEYHRGLIGEATPDDTIPVHKLYETNLTYTLKNIYAFANEDTTREGENLNPPTLGSLNPLDRSIVNSYDTRLKNNTSVMIHMDSVAYEGIDSQQGFGVGKTVEVDFPKFAPKLEDDTGVRDLINSGKYLISAVRHYISGNEYTMTLELIRDGMGEDAELYPTGVPEIDREPREREQIYEPIE